MGDETHIQRTIQNLLHEVQNARNDVLKADEARAKAADEMKRLTDYRGKPINQALDDFIIRGQRQAGRCEWTGDPLAPAHAVRIRCDGRSVAMPQGADWLCSLCRS
jgi:hypothetical protein